MTDAVALAQKLVRMNTAGGGEQEATEMIAGRLARAGARVTIVPFAPGRAHLVAFAGDVSRAPLVCSGHLDTVPFGDAPWRHDPLSGDVVDGWLYGRGAADMKSGVAALVVALERHLMRRQPGRGVVLALTAAEESGCEGSRHLVSTLDLPSGGPLLVAEPTANRIATGHKGVLWLKVTAAGRAAHGSRPDLGDNAIVSLARLAIALADEGLTGRHTDMGPVTVNVGTFAGGTKINLVPDSATMTLDVRMVPGVDPADVLARLRQLSGGAIDIEVLDDLAPAYCSPDGPFVRTMTDALESITGRAELRQPLTYFTDAAILTGALSCPEVVLFGPGDPDAAHTTDERCKTAGIETAAAVIERALDAWTAVA